MFKVFLAWLSIPKNYMLFSSAVNLAIVNLFMSDIDKMSDEDKDKLIEENQIRIDAKMEEMRTK